MTLPHYSNGKIDHFAPCNHAKITKRDVPRCWFGPAPEFTRRKKHG